MIKKIGVGDVLYRSLMWILMAVSVIPLIWVIRTAFIPSGKALNLFALAAPTLENIRHVLKSMKSVLNDKEYEVICCRFGLLGKKEQTQREIARHLHISRSYVSRIEKNALHKLRTLFPEN